MVRRERETTLRQRHPTREIVAVSLPVARALMGALAVYLGLGIAFAIPFVVRGIARIDPLAAHASAGFRVIVLPGAVILWPLLARRWWRGDSEAPEEHNPHRDAVATAAQR